MPADLYYHAAANSPKRLYVSGGLSIQDITPGGASLNVNTKVFSAPFRAEGELGEWTESGVLPEPLNQHGMAVVAGRLFIAGGRRKSAFTDAVRSAPLRADGSLGPWRKEASLPLPRGAHALVAHGDTLWVVGGSVRADYFTEGTRGLWRAKLSSDGEARVSRWETLEAPQALHYEQNVAVANGRLYAAQAQGGLFSLALDGGTPWRGEMTPPWMHDVDFGRSGLHLVRLVALPGMLLALVPHGLTFTADLEADGTVKNWRLASRLYNTDSGFATAVEPGGRVYVLGGTNSRQPVRRNAEVWSTTRLVPQP